METADIPTTQETSHIEITNEDSGYLKLRKKGLNFGPSDLILHHDNAPAHMALYETFITDLAHTHPVPLLWL
jgi:hypothetical protein